MKEKLFDSEAKVMEIIWKNSPISAKEISLIATETIGWNKNTTYTIIKTLVEMGAVERSEPDFLCTPLLSLEEVRRTETKGLVDKFFHGSASAFFSAFLEDENISEEELEALKKIINGKK